MTQAPLSPAPITESRRFETIDVVRGFALLGILVPNIVAFAWPAAAMADPSVIDERLGESAWNTVGHEITSVFFLGKMMALFSMLFGAGVIVYARKFERPDRCRRCGYDLAGLSGDAACPECGSSERGAAKLSAGWWLWYRRVAWLLAIGVAHAVLLWFGDILVWYAVVGLGAVWWVRRWNPKLQIALGFAAHLVSTLLMLGISFFGIWALENGKIPGGEIMGDPAAEYAAYTGGYLGQFPSRLGALVGFWFIFGPLFFPGITGLMMIGMGLTRMGILTGERPTRLYALMAILGIVGGLGLTATLFYGLTSADPEHGGFIWQSISQFVGIPVSLGYMGALIWIVKLGVLRRLTRLLANVGRMALSNYLLHTVLCTLFFYGHGLGQFGEIGYPGLFAVVAAVWVVNIVFSALWLKAFRFGPAEWAWRSLTYWKLQPIRR